MRRLFDKAEWLNANYDVGIADTPKEIDELHKLRYDIFNIELDEGIKENKTIQRDIDKFDAHCDHLIIKEKSGEIIATYRIHPSWKMHNEGFYTATEFEISKLGLEKVRSVEVGRACIHPEHRGKNLIIIMLWLGIRKYCQINNVEFLFGVASIPKCTKEEISSLYYDLINKGHLIEDGSVEPLPEQKAEIIKDAPETYRKELMGSLIKGYIKIGAKLIGAPVFDPIFGCYDFFVLLEMKKVNWEYIDSLSKLLTIEKS